MRHLLDGDYIERTDIGFEISDPCSCWKGGNPQNPLAARRPVGIVMRGAHGDAEAQLSGLVSPVSSLGVKSESVQNPVSLLARDFFPTVFSGDMRPQLNWQALARGLKIWRSDHSISLNTMRLSGGGDQTNQSGWSSWAGVTSWLPWWRVVGSAILATGGTAPARAVTTGLAVTPPVHTPRHDQAHPALGPRSTGP